MVRLLEKQMAEARQRGEVENNEEVVRKLERLRGSMVPVNEGRTLTAVRIEGLSDQLRNDLRGRIPVHIGEILTKESVERITTAVRQFDEHLEIRIRPSGEGRSDLIIVAPAGGDRFEYHVTEPERVRKYSE